MHLETGYPMKGRLLKRLIDFLKACGLDYDEGIDYTVALMQEDEIIAAGSLDGGTLKCIAVSPQHQGEGLLAILMTRLKEEAFNRGLRHLMLFTKPQNRMMFADLGFHTVIQTDACLLMESVAHGLQDFLNTLERPVPSPEGAIGCVVANCNPFTRGHRWLIEKAAGDCAWLHVFILSEDRSQFPPDVRLDLARKGCTDLKNITFHPTGPYLISSATFPSYFIKDKGRVGAIHCELDIRLFAEKFAPTLGISRRYVGTEPYCEVTRAYNDQLKRRLPEYGIEVRELSRLDQDGGAVSASRVRALFQAGQLEDLRSMVPESTYEYLCAVANRSGN